MGVVCKDGIILGTEKIVMNKMMVSGTDKRLYSVSKNAGCAVNGMIPDGRSVMFRAREECEQYEKNFGIKIPGAVLADRMALQFHQKTVYASYRPHGTSAIFAAWDMMKGGSLWMIEPSGQMFQYFGCASGRGKQLCRNEIEKGKFRELTVAEALPKVAKMLLKAQDEMREKKMEIELSVLGESTKWAHKLIDRATCDRMTTEAQEAIDNEDDEMN
jgi:20S proteasome subunit alpha 7